MSDVYFFLLLWFDFFYFFISVVCQNIPSGNIALDRDDKMTQYMHQSCTIALQKVLANPYFSMHS